MDNLVGTIASRRGRWYAASLACALALAAALAAPYAGVRLGESVAFLTIFLTLAASADTLTAFLLASQGRVSGSLASMLLASGYLFSALAIVVHTLVFPGIFSPHGALAAGVQTATWFWVWWHGGFPLFVIAYAVAHVADAERNRTRRFGVGTIVATAVGIVSSVGILTVETIARENSLPTIIHRGQYGLLIATGIGPLVLVSIASGIAALLWFTRLRTVTDVWLTVALVSSFLDVALTLVAGGRYTVGWYVARVESLFASTVVLLTFLGAIDQIFSRLAKLSRIDGLTGLSNRRDFDEEIAAGVVLARRTHSPISLLMLDVDSFKAFNDTYGHARGDDALRIAAAAIANSLVRRSDIAARYGGEEFAIVLPATDAFGALVVADRIRANIQATGLPHAASGYGVVTASVGASTLDAADLADGFDQRALLERADEALYRAKASGRNQIASAMRSNESAAGVSYDRSPVVCKNES